jgi:hypothetical protein
VGSASVSSGVATLSGVKVTAAPGQRTVGATFTSSDARILGSKGSKALTVKAESATAVLTSKPLVLAASTTATSVKTGLRTTVRDITDASRGDIRTSRVSFVNRATGAALSGCSNLPVSLVVASDPTVGTATCSPTLPMTAPGTTYVVGTVVTGNYSDRTGSEDRVVTLARPYATRLDAAAGVLRVVKSAGSLAATLSSPIPVGLAATYSSTHTNPTGTVAVLWQHGGHTYQATGTALTSASGTVPAATVQVTCVVRDVTSRSAVTTVATGAKLRFLATDRRTAPPDLAGVEVRTGTGTLLLATRWDGTKMIQQALESGDVLIR